MANPFRLLAFMLCSSVALSLPTALQAQQPTVTLTVPDGTAAEAAQDPASFTLTRTTDAGTEASLRVYLQLGGTATRSTDYATTNLIFAGGDSYFATIPAGEASIAVTFTPGVDNRIEGEETITYILLGPQLVGNDYTLGVPDSGDATITDDVAEVSLTVGDAEATELTEDPASFVVSRDNHDDMAAALRVYPQLGGTATRSTDYTATNLTFAGSDTYFTTTPASQQSQTIVITPMSDLNEEGDETVTLMLLEPQLAGNDYTIGALSQGLVTLPKSPTRSSVTASRIFEQRLSPQPGTPPILRFPDSGLAWRYVSQSFECGQA